MLKKGKVCVPKDEVLKVEIIWLYHDTSVTRYKRKWKMIELVIINYWWPRVTRDMGKYIKCCDICQRMKNRIEELAGKLKLSEVPEKLWIYLTVDFIIKLLLVAGKDEILVVCNRLLKITHFVATTEGTLVSELQTLNSTFF